MQVLPDGRHIPLIAVPGHGARECRKVRAELQCAVIAVLEQSLLVNTQKLFCLLD